MNCKKIPIVSFVIIVWIAIAIGFVLDGRIIIIKWFNVIIWIVIMIRTIC